ncbi:MAG: hypothetical protein WC845_02505 [Candidatus Staskawiczbacteria bacterium]
MKDICVWFVAISSIFFSLCYVFQIWRRKATPTLSTWIIFLVGCCLSFSTYVVAANKDIKSGVLNTVDLTYVSIILLAILLWGKHEVRLKSFEKWYLIGAVAIMVYGLVTGNAWTSNVMTQILMSFAYFPMFHKLISQKKNTESFFAWIPAAVNALVALYPAIHDGNTLAVIYATRAFSLSLTTALIMAYYQLKDFKK